MLHTLFAHCHVAQESFKFVSLLRLRPTKTRAARRMIGWKAVLVVGKRVRSVWEGPRGKMWQDMAFDGI